MARPVTSEVCVLTPNPCVVILGFPEQVRGAPPAHLAALPLTAPYKTMYFLSVGPTSSRTLCTCNHAALVPSLDYHASILSPRFIYMC